MEHRKCMQETKHVCEMDTLRPIHTVRLATVIFFLLLIGCVGAGDNVRTTQCKKLH